MSAAPTVAHTRCSSALNPCRIPGLDWCVNPYVGCSHGCAYCYAAFMRRFSHHDEAWGTFVNAKDNIAEVLHRQTRRWHEGHVALSTVTDAYQPVEKELRLTRACLEVLVDAGMSVAIHTKSDLVLRDLDLLRSVGGLLRQATARVGFSLITLSDELSLLLEPGAPPPSRRLQALEALVQAGIPTWVFIAPILPGLTDSPADLQALVREIRRRGTLDIQFDPLNFYPGAVTRLEEIVRRNRLAGWSGFCQAVANPDRWREQASRVASAALQTASR